MMKALWPEVERMPPVASGPGLLSPGLLLELYDAPVAFHRAFIELGGGVTAALFLSCACQEAAELPLEGDGWLRLGAEKWRELTGLTRHEMDSARKALRDRGLIEERRVGLPARLEIRIAVAQLLARLRDQAARHFPNVTRDDHVGVD